MNTASYSQYSVGVKTQNKSKKLLRTRSRAMLGAFVLSDLPTDIDPNRLLMRKDSAKIFSVNEQDINNLMSEKDYTFEKAIAYYEAVSQIPHASMKLEFYTNAKHKSPKISEGVEMEMPKLTWFSNSWTGHSWVANMIKKDGGIPCFWTKDLSGGSDPFSKSWSIYEKRFPKRGWRVTYDVHDTVESVFGKLLSFIMYHSSEPELHIWIQGNLKGLDPSKMVEKLTDMLASGNSLDSSGKQSKMSKDHDDEIPIIILPAGTGKTTYSKRHDSLVDIDDIINDPSVKDEMEDLRRKAADTNEWSIVNTRNGELVKAFMKAGRLEGKILLAHGDDMFGDVINTKTLGGMKLSKSEMQKIRDERAQSDEMWAELTELNWETSDQPIGSRKDIDDMIERIMSESVEDDPVVYAPSFMISKEYISLWSTPLDDSIDTWEAFGSGSPQRIPLIPWRVSNVGPRIFHKGIPPQLFPPTTFMMERGISMLELQFTEVYSNYSEFVIMRPITDDELETLDFGWLPVGDNMYVMSKIDEDDYSSGLLTVDDRDFFLGCGSVVTSAHACFGLGRSNTDLISQRRRKEATGYGTSGHMIASVLSFQSHFLWYLEEVYMNLKTNRSVYVTTFNEPEEGAYHTIHEYRNAVLDMKLLDSKGMYPKYARNNFRICETFVRYLNL
uniref:VP7 n=1 Tax=viral metagenome TaxID=1070528 RepID=A0A2V0RB52_9ZZZZ